MNKKRIIISIITVLLFTIIFIASYEIFMSKKEEDSRERIFSDMKEMASNASRGVIGIIAENVNGGNKSHDGIGSGVIFDRKGNIYYAVTAKHVVDVKYDKLKIFTRDTEFAGETVKVDENVNFEIPDVNYYDSMLDGIVEYKSDTDDIAIISFQYDGDLTVLEFETEKISKNDKILVIGHTEGNRYKESYGYIKSGLQRIKFSDKEERVVEHDAYMKQGNSGGVALNKNMKIVGINIVGSFTRLGHFVSGFMVPYGVVEENIENWRNE